MKVTVEGEELVIRMPLVKPFPLSESGKNFTIASSRGPVQTPTQVDGEFVTVGVNAYIRNPSFVKGPKVPR